MLFLLQLDLFIMNHLRQIGADQLHLGAFIGIQRLIMLLILALVDLIDLRHKLISQ